MTLGTHTVGGGVEEVLSTADPILVGTACGPADAGPPVRIHRRRKRTRVACADQTSVKRDPL